jgi:hypothetical protein
VQSILADVLGFGQVQFIPVADVAIRLNIYLSSSYKVRHRPNATTCSGSLLSRPFLMDTGADSGSVLCESRYLIIIMLFCNAYRLQRRLEAFTVESQRCSRWRTARSFRNDISPWLVQQWLQLGFGLRLGQELPPWPGGVQYCS